MNGKAIKAILKKRDALDDAWDILTRVRPTPEHNAMKDKIEFAIATLESLAESLEDEG